MVVSNFLAISLLNQVFRNVAYTRPTTVYIALYTSDPTVADTGTEVTGGSYARQAVALGAPAVVGGKQSIKNSADIPFLVASADWGNVTHVGIRDAASAGNLLYFGPLTSARAILSGDRYNQLANSLTLTLS